MIFWSLCAFIWFKNMKKMLLQMTSGFLQLESTIYVNKKNQNLEKEEKTQKASGEHLYYFFPTTYLESFIYCPSNTLVPNRK
jgi:hypothetical protein